MSQTAPMNTPVYDPFVIQAILDARAPWPTEVIHAFDCLDFEMKWWICRRETRERMAKLVPGSFKHTLIKQDEEFYAYFHGARQHAMEEWRSARITAMPGLLPYSPVDQNEVESFLPSPSISVSPLVQSPTPVPALHYDYTMAEAPPSAYEFQPLPIVSFPVPGPEDDAPVMPQLYYPSPSSSPSPPPSEPDVSPAPYRVIRSPAALQFTGDWEADAIANSDALPKLEQSEADLDMPLTPTEGRELETPHRPRQVRPRHPRDSLPRLKIPKCRKDSTSSCTESPGVCSPDHCVEKRGKPVSEGKMACLFCRGRKIACSSPGDENPDKTCNQCARRGLSCVYPTENRRGMRKRKCDLL